MNNNKFKQLIRKSSLLSRAAKVVYDWQGEKKSREKIKNFLALKELPYSKQAPAHYGAGHEPTIRCNLKCKMCYQGQTRALRQSELTAEEVLKVYRNLEGKIKSIKIVGGEPMVREDIFSMLAFWDKRGVNITLQSNCTLVNKSNIYELAKYKYLKDVAISLDGPEEVHDRIRGVPGTFKRLKNAIELIRKYRPDIRLTAFGMYLPHEGTDNLYKIIDTGLELGLSSINILFEQVYTKGEEDASRHIAETALGWERGSYRFNTQIREQLFPENLDIAEIKKELNKVHKYGLKKNCFANFTPMSYYYNIERYLSHNPGRVLCRKLLKPELRVNQKGQVIWCDVIEKPFGSLLEKTPDQIWLSDDLQKFRQYLWKKSLPICKRCCKGVCI